MRNSAAFWEKTARIGELCWVRRTNRGYKYDVGIVVEIENYSYWCTASYQDWVYYILIGDKIIRKQSWYVEKIVSDAC